MAKKLYTVRLVDGIPMEFDGATWRTMTSPYSAPTSAPSGGSTDCALPRGMFAYRGRLYFIYLYGGISTLNTARNIRIYSVNPTDDTYTFVTDNALASVSGSNITAGSFSTFYNYKDRMYFTLSGGLPTLGAEQKVQMGFVFDGTTLTATTFSVSPYTGFTTGTTFSPRCAMTGLTIPYKDKLVVVPKGAFKVASGTSSNGSVYFNNRFYTVDYNPNSVGGTILSLPDSASGYDVVNTQSGTFTPEELNRFFSSYVGGGVYRNTLYGIGAEGIVYRLTDGGSRTEMFDLRNFGRRSPTYTTTTNGFVTAALKFTGSSFGINTAIQQIPLGSKAVIRSGAYTGAQGIVIDQTTGVAGQHLSLVDFTTRQAQAPWNDASIVTGTQVDFYYGTGPGLPYNGGAATSAGAMCQVIMQEGKDGNFYILVTHRTLAATATPLAVMSYMYKWDGTTNPTSANLTYQECRIAGKAMECSGIDSYYDISNGMWHILYYDATAQTVIHFAWDTVNDRQLVFGSIYAKSNTLENAGLASGLLTPYVTNDITYEFISKTFNEVTKLMTVVVRAYCINDATSFLQVKYNVGNSWTLATLVGQTSQGVVGGVFANSTGTDFTYIHDLGTDEPTYSGTLQYEITGGAGVSTAYSSHSSATTLSNSSSTSSSSRTPSSNSTSSTSTSSRTPSSNSSSTSSSSS